MKAPWVLVLLLVYLLTGCGNDDGFGQKPCPFAPPESDFPIISNICEDCYFNIQFREQEYSFSGNQFTSPYFSDHTQADNAFLSFYLISPISVSELDQGIDVKTPLLEIDAIDNLTVQPPSVTVAFGIYNYCKDLFQPATNDVSQSYHQLTSTELIESYPTALDNEPYQISFYYLIGELQATFNINGEEDLVTAEYKVKCQIYEKL